MRVKQLAVNRFEVVGVMDGDACPAELFLLEGEKATEANRLGLTQILATVAERDLDGVPSAWVHEANKSEKIYEFIKGPLRLFFFKGKNGQIVVCTSGVRKSGQKADKAAVKRSARWREEYYTALENDALTTVDNDEA